MRTARLHFTEPQDRKLDWPISEARLFGCAVEVEVEVISRKFGQVVKKNTACLLTSRDGFGGRMGLRSLHSRWQHGAPTGQRLSRSETRHAPPCPGRSGPDRPLARALGGTGGLKGQLAGRFPHPTSPISHPNHPQGKSSSASFLFVVTLCWSEATGFHAIPAADQPR